ncbi:RsmB/NOP family class I SAM-dependent RNA methyltransferase [Chelatococcus reniformis]|uniref:MFS transporter n=1 Tax=Chelatococcus reniformis TaxID=1494448 RepID=A0A916TY05_9HYPH|nr:transcription antitermination factor NusB [Chelatococcus reniformis]GGC50423.1 MFS transporter [Chelatococcus reniformis]
MGLRQGAPPRRRGADPRGGASARRPPESAGVAPRRAAVAALVAVLGGGEGIDGALAEASEGLADRDRALARAITTVALRRLGSIRALLGRRLERGYPRKCGSLEPILVTAAAQILYLDVPDHAVVDIAVSLAKADRNAAPFAGLVNAVLRRLPRGGDEAEGDPLAHDTPAWLATRWTGAYGADEARAIAAAHRHEAGLDLSVVGDAAAWAEQLDAVVLPLGPPAATTTVRLRDSRPVVALPGFDEGRWWVQDAAAALPARLLGVSAGERVADLCAAPGGKTAQLVAAGAHVVAVDRSPERMGRLAANMERLGLAPEQVVADVLALETDPFDAILLDAPCSATGTIRRHPDVAWVKRPGDIASLVELQGRLLDKAVSLLRPGGRLVYSTCSLEPEEGEGQIEALLARAPGLERLPIAADELGALAGAITPRGDVRTLPSMLPDAEPRLSGLDGFFMARLQRAG